MNPNLAPMRQLLTTRQLEEKYGISQATWRWWRMNNLGPAAIVLGRRKVVYDPDVVERWIAAHAEPETPAGGAA